jgi:hypothetical protein
VTIELHKSGSTHKDWTESLAGDILNDGGGGYRLFDGPRPYAVTGHSTVASRAWLLNDSLSHG